MLTHSTKYNIDEIRKIRIAKVAGLTDTRSRVAIRCPFHSEKTPSCVIYKDNSFHCFGCQAHGSNAIDFVMKLGCNFNDAVKELANYL